MPEAASARYHRNFNGRALVSGLLDCTPSGSPAAQSRRRLVKVQGRDPSGTAMHMFLGIQFALRVWAKLVGTAARGHDDAQQPLADRLYLSSRFITFIASVPIEIPRSRCDQHSARLALPESAPRYLPRHVVIGICFTALCLASNSKSMFIRRYHNAAGCCCNQLSSVMSCQISFDRSAVPARSSSTSRRRQRDSKSRIEPSGLPSGDPPPWSADHGGSRRAAAR